MRSPRNRSLVFLFGSGPGPEVCAGDSEPAKFRNGFIRPGVSSGLSDDGPTSVDTRCCGLAKSDAERWTSRSLGERASLPDTNTMALRLVNLVRQADLPAAGGPVGGKFWGPGGSQVKKGCPGQSVHWAVTASRIWAH
jgi:hypothetical protein